MSSVYSPVVWLFRACWAVQISVTTRQALLIPALSPFRAPKQLDRFIKMHFPPFDCVEPTFGKVVLEIPTTTTSTKLNAPLERERVQMLGSVFDFWVPKLRNSSSMLACLECTTRLEVKIQFYKYHYIFDNDTSNYRVFGKVSKLN